MKKLARSRSAAEREARRNYVIFCVTSFVAITGFVGGISLYIYAT